jgi:hypothetical protein
MGDGLKRLVLVVGWMREEGGEAFEVVKYNDNAHIEALCHRSRKLKRRCGLQIDQA